MDLKFIYIKSYKNLKDFQVSFCNQENQKISYRNSEIWVDQGGYTHGGFFGHNITAVNAIIGDNGSGKTNLADFIHLNLSNFNRGMAHHFDEEVQAIFVLGNIIAHHQNVKITNQQILDKLNFRVLEYEHSPYEVLWEEQFYEYKLDKTSYVYFSNILNDRTVFWLDNLSDVSTTYLLQSDVYDSAFSSRNKPLLASELSAFSQNEGMRIADYLLNVENDLINPSNLSFHINISTSLSNYHLESNSNSSFVDLESSLLQDFFTTREHVEYNYKYQFKLNDIKYYSSRLLLLNILKTVNLNLVEGYQEFIFDDNFLLPSKKFSKLNRLKKTILKLIEQAIWEDGVYYEVDEPNYIIYKSKFQRHIPLMTRLRFENFKGGVKRQIKLFVRLIKELNIQGKFGFYNFEYELSSGENSVLILYSRLFYAKTQLKSEVNHLKIFIDEGEVNLHPEWQRLYFQRLLKFIGVHLCEYQVQLIITSHNPFLASDLPKADIIFLKRGNDGYSELSSFDRQRTFASNIHSLLTDSFFMKDGLIGAFAKERIEQLIQFLESSEIETVDWNQQRANEIIDLIGDDLIRNRLFDIFREKFDQGLDIEDEINNLEFRLKYLKSKRDNYD